MKTWIKFQIALALFLPLSVNAEVNLFEYVASDQNYSSKHNANKQTTIKISQKILDFKPSDIVAISLPDGSRTNFTITGKKLLTDNNTVLTGESKDGMNFVITVGKEAIYGNIFGKGRKYGVGTIADNVNVLIDQSKPTNFQNLLKRDFLMPPTFKKKNRDIQKLERQALNSSQNNISTIRVLFIYSNEYGAAVANTTTRFNQMIAFSNSAFSRSGIKIELEFAGSTQIGFDNSKSISTLLDEVTFGKTQFTGVSQLRDSTYADLVAVFSLNSNPFSTSGVAWVNGNDPDYGFSAMKYPSNGSDSVFTHEIGHNLGSGHEHASANPSQTSPCNNGGFTGYSCGHGIPNGWGTIMSYLDLGAVNYVFSDPLKSTCQGEPCGIAQGQTGAADNVKSFNITRSLIANFRGDPPPGTTPPTTTPPTTTPPTTTPPTTSSPDEDNLCIPLKSSNNKFAIICL